jgi:hypothetical protein
MLQISEVMVIYDGLSNSVCEGQVLTPLCIRASRPILISFESHYPDSKLLTTIKKRFPQLTIIILKKRHFIGLFSLYPAVRQLRHLLCKEYHHYNLTARGPLAGAISLKAYTNKCQNLLIQVRGLLAEEYRYSCANQLTLWHRIRINSLSSLEKYVYHQAMLSHHSLVVTIEAVSTALKDYLIKTYTIASDRITLAKNDIPALLPVSQLKLWRVIIRNRLKIPHTATVYCYNGSIKPWQCPTATLLFFLACYSNNPDCHLLLLTQDVSQFEELARKAKIPNCSITILSVPYATMYHYLAACDIGIIFRKHHIINWTSRPTKVLEYQAARLPIVHNNSIAYLAMHQNL